MRTRTRNRSILSLVLLMALVFSACGADKKETSAPAAGTKITIKDFKFDPPTLVAKVGDTITVTNADSAEHTVTAKDKSFDTGFLKQGQTATFQVTKPGTFDYVCTPHSGFMSGVIQVS